jgi:hypothetical protein
VSSPCYCRLLLRGVMYSAVFGEFGERLDISDLDGAAVGERVSDSKVVAAHLRKIARLCESPGLTAYAL